MLIQWYLSSILHSTTALGPTGTSKTSPPSILCWSSPGGTAWFGFFFFISPHIANIKTFVTRDSSLPVSLYPDYVISDFHLSANWRWFPGIFLELINKHDKWAEMLSNRVVSRVPAGLGKVWNSRRVNMVNNQDKVFKICFWSGSIQWFMKSQWPNGFLEENWRKFSLSDVWQPDLGVLHLTSSNF